MTHNYHPHVYAPEAGNTTGPVLADGCPRCEEIATNPQAHLDQRRITELRRRHTTGTPPLSKADAHATMRLEAVLPATEYA